MFFENRPVISTVHQSPSPQPLPSSFALQQNFPNPFNPETVIRYAIPTSAYVQLAIYNVRGQRQKVLVAAMRAAGQHQVSWDGRNDRGERVAAGLYFYRLRSGDVLIGKKMLLLP